MRNLNSYFKHAKRIFIKRGLPIQLIYFVTSNCNLRCIHCFYWERLNCQTNELLLPEIEKISKSIGDLLWLSLTGGEPFLRNDLPDIASLFYKHTGVKYITIPTNGLETARILALTEKILSLVPKSHLVIYVSLDGFEKTHDQIRNYPGSFQNSLDTLRGLKKLKKKFNNLGVSTLTTYLSLNQKELKDFFWFIQGYIQPDNMTINLGRGNMENGRLKEFQIDYYGDVVRVKRQAIANKNFPYYDSKLGKLLLAKDMVMYDLVDKTFRENRFQSLCYAGSLSGVMSETGEIFPCELLNESMGNVREYYYNLRQLWMSPRANEVRRKIKKSKCFCTWECALNTNILFNMRYYPRLLRQMVTKKKDKGFSNWPK